MNQLLRVALALGCLSIAGCAGGEAVDEIAEAAHDDGCASSAAPGATSVRLRGCAYLVSTVENTTSLPPTFDVVVTRRPSARCAEETVVVPSPGPNFINPAPLVTTRGGQALVVAFAFKGTPSGSAAVAAEIVALSPSLDVIRTAELRTLATPPVGGTATVNVDALFFEGNRLIVEGTKTGTFGPGGAAGGSFTAVFPKFLQSSEPPVITVTP